MSEVSVEAVLRLIAETVDLDGSIDEHTPLISSGMVDSFDIVTLVTAMEEHFGVRLAVEDLSVEAFDTPEQMFGWIRGDAP